jgi:hypothetical protein
MKNYKQVYLIVKDRNFKYEAIANIPEFNNQEEALVYWKYNKEPIKDCNFYDDPIAIVRKETNIVEVQTLN